MPTREVDDGNGRQQVITLEDFLSHALREDTDECRPRVVQAPVGAKLVVQLDPLIKCLWQIAFLSNRGKTLQDLTPSVLHKLVSLVTLLG